MKVVLFLLYANLVLIVVQTTKEKKFRSKTHLHTFTLTSFFFLKHERQNRQRKVCFKGKDGRGLDLIW
jgi:hypothetical protein